MSRPSSSAAGQHTTKIRMHASRLSHVALETLNDWLKTHSQLPYPTKAEKLSLQRATGLDLRQIETWFANARRRQKCKPFVASMLHDLSTTPSLRSADEKVLNHRLRDDTPTTLPVVTSFVSSPARKIYHCTFCTDNFETKYDWTRHEISVHLPLKRYICCPLTPIFTDSNTTLERCAYCGEPSPNTEHTESHNHSACQARRPEARIFLRKDHLRQHLRAVHECELLPNMDTWVLQADYVNSRCGFCGNRFTSWKARNEHIAVHYKQGFEMSMWKGCRGLDSAISAQVKAGLPPFLINIAKQASQDPCSTLVMAQYQTSLTKARNNDRNSCSILRLEFLVQELQKLVKQFTVQGFMVSDQTLQDYARTLIYGRTSAASSTAADNPEWLDTFKRAYCLNILPTSSHNHALHLPDDLEVYNDLGLPTPQCPRSDRATAFWTLFWADEPVLKTDRRFSSVAVPLQLALPFETIAGVWPDAGTLGRIMVTRDRVFEMTIKAQIGSPLLMEVQTTIEADGLGEEDARYDG